MNMIYCIIVHMEVNKMTEKNRSRRIPDELRLKIIDLTRKYLVELERLDMKADTIANLFGIGKNTIYAWSQKNIIPEKMNFLRLYVLSITQVALLPIVTLGIRYSREHKTKAPLYHSLLLSGLVSAGGNLTPSALSIMTADTVAWGLGSAAGAGLAIGSILGPLGWLLNAGVVAVVGASLLRNAAMAPIPSALPPEVMVALSIDSSDSWQTIVDQVCSNPLNHGQLNQA
jgi:hypothetical protein